MVQFMQVHWKGSGAAVTLSTADIIMLCETQSRDGTKIELRTGTSLTAEEKYSDLHALLAGQRPRK